MSSSDVSIDSRNHSNGTGIAASSSDATGSIISAISDSDAMSSVSTANGKGQSQPAPMDICEDSEDDKPLSASKPRAANKRNKSQKKVANDASDDENDSSSDDNDNEDDDYEDKPLSSRKNSSSKKVVVKDESDSDDEPLSKRKVVKDESDSDDEPISKKKASKKKNLSTVKITGKRKTPEASDASDEDDEPLSKRVKTTNGKSKPKSNGKVKDEVKVKVESNGKTKRSDDAASKKAAKRAKKIKEEPGSSPAKKADNDEEEDDEFAWWKNYNPHEDNGIKWNTLEHNGVYFPPPYVPHGIPLKYEGKEIKLEPDAEEIATFFAACLGTPHAENPTFCANFFSDFLEVLAECKQKYPIKEFSKCNFTAIADHLNVEKERKKQMTKEEKEKIKQDKKAIDDKYGWALVDGRKEKVGNFRIEPPGLFRGRGEHPRTGHLKKRVQPEQVTINIGKDAPIPKPPEGHKWKSVIHDNTVTWLATWQENVNNNTKYVFLAANSSWKGMSDFKKFEKARELKKHVHRIRKDYTEALTSKVMEERQRATALYLIDRFALRAGNEKGDDEADTVGCCSLRFEHVTLEPPHKVIFDFLGKDSIRYYNEVEVDPQVFKNLRLFKKSPKEEGDMLFDRLSTTTLNKHLNTIMPGLTAKVFRTYNASFTFQKELVKTPEDGSVQEKVLAYNRANREVAILCNHQRTVTKGHAASMAKLGDKIRAVKYQKRQVREQILDAEPKLAKKRPELVEEESDLDDDWVKEYLVLCEQKEEEKRKKQLEKLNEKRKEEGLKELKELPEKDREKVKKEKPLEKLEAELEKLDGRIKALKTQLIDKDENKTTALGTSKINYIDPRITAAWCKKYEVPVEKMFTKTLREKFKWAMDVEAEWEF